MKYIKLSKLIVVMMFCVNITMADNIDIVVPSKEGGGIFTLSNFVSKELLKQGIATTTSVKGDCVNGMYRFRQTTQPSILIISSGKNASLTSRKGCTIQDEKEFESVYLISLLRAVDSVCTVKNTLTIKSLRNGKQYVVGVDVSRQDRAGLILSQLNIKHKIIVYSNSTKAMQGLVAGDSDILWTNAKESPKVQKAGGTCLFVATKNSMNGIPGLAQISSLKGEGLSNYYWVLTKNLNAQQKQKLLTSFEIIKQSDEIKTLSKKKWLPMVDNEPLARVEIKNFVLNLK